MFTSLFVIFSAAHYFDIDRDLNFHSIMVMEMEFLCCFSPSFAVVVAYTILFQPFVCLIVSVRCILLTKILMSSTIGISYVQEYCHLFCLYNVVIIIICSKHLLIRLLTELTMPVTFFLTKIN